MKSNEHLINYLPFHILHIPSKIKYMENTQNNNQPESKPEDNSVTPITVPITPLDHPETPSVQTTEVKEVTIGKEIPTSNIEPNKQSSRLVAAAVFAFILIACVTIFALVGYIPNTQGSCAYQGPFAPYGVCTSKSNTNNQSGNTQTTSPSNQTDSQNNQTTGSLTGSEDIPDPKKDAEELITQDSPKPVRKQYEGYEWFTDKSYEFAYPTSWIVKPLENDPNFLFIYSRDPALSASTINENVSIVPIALVSNLMDESSCKALADKVVKDATGSFDSIQLEEYAPIQINKKNACRISVKSTVSGLTVRQVQHIFVNQKDPSKSYVLTATQEEQTQNSQNFYNIFESFYIL